MKNNGKYIGEKGERIAIGELAKFDVEILQVIGDNLPFDFVIYKDDKFYKCQVKTSTRSTTNTEGSLFFSLVSTNWYSKTTHFYTKNEVDIFILCDLQTIYLFRFDELKNRRSISIRKIPSKNNIKKSVTFAKDVVISKDRLKHVMCL